MTAPVALPGDEKSKDQRSKAKSGNRRNEMSRFSLELTQTLRAALNDAAIQIQSDSRTKAFMAEQILRAAADGVHRREELSDIAIKAVRLEGTNRLR
jgi:hypothetical protein